MPRNASLYLYFVLAVLGYHVVRRAILLTRSFFEWASSQDWPQTVGRVISSDVVSVPIPLGGKGPSYEYHVDGHTFMSKKIYVGQDSFASNFEKSGAVVDKYPKNKSLVVFYNPTRPEISFLERKVPENFTGNLISGILLLSLTFLLFYFVLTTINK
ncbi:MAG: DUF3592 domain-containing protein [Anaerolineales bacterium]|nr:DUF3592 domain-containing protein [Anaerolineales bacterium]